MSPIRAINRFGVLIWLELAVVGASSIWSQEARPVADRLRALQNEYVDTKNEERPRVYHWGSQGPGDVFSNHTSHTNRLVPVYVFGRKADLSAFAGSNSCYRDQARIRQLYGRVPEHTHNPEADYADQTDLYRLQLDAIERGAKHIFIVWFDGLDWETTQDAAIAKTGQVYTEGKGTGLVFQDYAGAGPVQFGYVVTAPARDDPRENQYNVNRQTVGDLSSLLGGGYDARFGGSNPWTPGPLFDQARGYFKGQGMTRDERAALDACGGVAHAYTDSAPSAGAVATGAKSFNGGINFSVDGTALPTLFQKLQEQGWKAGTVTNVPFSHASPAAFYAHNVTRDDYQDLSREMLGLRSIVQETGKGPRLPGLEVVIGCGWGVTARESDLAAKQGTNAVAGNTYITEADLRASDVAHGGRYVVAQRTRGLSGRELIERAAEQAARDGARLFGFFGTRAGHLPYRTADGDYLPAKGIRGVAERYTSADLHENPTLADMTRAALKVLGAGPDGRFALFVEAGDVDFALHDNNLDNAIGAIYDGEDAIRAIIEWVEKHSNWDESVIIVTADHGHYLVLDEPSALAGAARDSSQ